MNADDLRTSSQAVGFDRLNKLFGEILEMGSQLIMAGLGELRERIDKSICASKEPVDTPFVEKPDDGCRVVSPLAVRAKGRPPFKRKVSRVDVAARRKRESVRKKLCQQKWFATPPRIAEDHQAPGSGWLPTQESVVNLSDGWLTHSFENQESSGMANHGSHYTFSSPLVDPWGGFLLRPR